MSTKIKICDVRNMEALKLCVDNNVDFIGLHKIELPITTNDIALFNQIVSASGNIRTVVLTKIELIDDIVMLLKQVPFDYIQLHRPTSVEEICEIKRKIKAITGREIGVIAVFGSENCDYTKVQEISHYADFILIDYNYRGGTGRRIDSEKLRVIAENCEGIQYFIAGGLNPDNVEEVIRYSKPYAVDVQTGLESAKHIKDPKLVKDFVEKVRSLN